MFDATVVPRLARLMRRLQVDVVQSYLFDAEIAVRLAGRAARIPLIVGSERNTEYYIKPRQLRAYALTRTMVDLIIANSNAGAAFNARMLGQPAAKYRVIHNGVNTGTFAPRDRTLIRQRLGVRADEPLVGMFASFKEQKNHPLAFAAARRVLAAVPAARFMFVGDQLHGGLHGSDAYKARMDALVDELGLRERCLFLGNRDDVADLYSACDLTILPSKFEGTPNVALESMASGVAVVATDVADNAIVIPDGRAGFVVALGDEAALADRIVRLVADSALREQMGRQARAWVEQEFSTERLAAKTEIIFREFLERAPKHPRRR